jgi:DNA-directed RNA polymerase specialized sigma24 family protein
METHNPRSGKTLVSQPVAKYRDATVEMENFCDLWKRDVYAFCKAFVGNERAAEDATCEVFVTACRRTANLPQGTLRSHLIGLALQTIQRWERQPTPCCEGGSRLEHAILRLPANERAVVIMRNLLRMDWASVALAMGLSAKRAHELWVRGVIQLNEFLQQDWTGENR